MIHDSTKMSFNDMLAIAVVGAQDANVESLNVVSRIPQGPDMAMTWHGSQPNIMFYTCFGHDVQVRYSCLREKRKKQ